MDKPMTIEQANEMLENTIRQLEDKAMPLEESVALYSKACELMAYCMEQLNSFQGRIEDASKRLSQQAAGEEPFHE